MLNKLVVFTLDEQRYALHLGSVERVVHAVDITCLPQAPNIILGVINIHGKIIPVINIRKRFCLPERELEINDRLILAHTRKREVVLVVDTVTDVIESPEVKTTATEKIAPNIDYIEGITKIDDGIILIHDLEKFLSLDEEQTLDYALGKMKP
jgi:purine-binding chemotaxis protein CheW